jgi:hypothetical protein
MNAWQSINLSPVESKRRSQKNLAAATVGAQAHSQPAA